MLNEAGFEPDVSDEESGEGEPVAEEKLEVFREFINQLIWTTSKSRRRSTSTDRPRPDTEPAIPRLLLLAPRRCAIVRLGQSS